MPVWGNALCLAVSGIGRQEVFKGLIAIAVCDEFGILLQRHTPFAVDGNGIRHGVVERIAVFRIAVVDQIDVKFLTIA